MAITEDSARPKTAKKERVPRTAPLPKEVGDKLSQKIEELLHDQGRTKTQLGEALGWDKSSVARALGAPHRFLDKIQTLVQFFHVDVQLFEKIIEGAEGKVIPAIESWDYIFKDHKDPNGSLLLPRTCIVRMVQTADPPYTAKWLLLAPRETDPRDGDLVWVLLSGAEWVRRWSPLANSETHVTLQAYGQRPVMCALGEILERRVVISPLERKVTNG